MMSMEPVNMGIIWNGSDKGAPPPLLGRILVALTATFFGPVIDSRSSGFAMARFSSLDKVLRS